ncbi:DUF2497 domain-containing protein [Algihabitans albus]|uniref:DUF2497 domain-containing protein n=1 Tax=Algihabitans albus TaxID=2164067 RepID=UPI000E5D711B|nr:DUF2497 domain-containing protein [Algihabitans albus]
MSEATKQDQQEPSMEEILASIRRIISDDGNEQQGQGAAAETSDSDASETGAPEASAAETGASASPDTMAGSDVPEAEGTPAPAAPATDTGEKSGGAIDLRAETDPTNMNSATADSEADAFSSEVSQEVETPDEEPLDLTQAVQGDGTVIDLAAERAAQARANAPEMDSTMDATAEAPVEPAAVIDAEPDEQPEADQIPAGAGLELSATDEEADSPQAEADPFELAPESAEEDMSDTPKSDTADHERLVSEATEAATLAALSSVATPPQAAQPVALSGGERTLEQVVRDAIAEHLKVWLDTNLPDLVERVVREEVRRLARRAEDS